MSEITTWPGWECVRKLGEGSFGSVYEIRRIENGIEFKAALKVISIPRNVSELQSAYSDGMDERSATAYFRSMVDSITKEYATMAHLKGHSNIVSYEDHEVIEHKDGIGWDILIRMELLTPLLTFTRDHPLSEQDVIKLGQDICRALDVCEKQKIIHRDIKPENIFVSSYGDFKLGDFGIARTVEKNMSNMTKTGTYPYMAPEIFLNRPYGQTADIYSLGMVLYRFLNDSRLPFYPLGVLTSKDKENALQRRMSGEPVPHPAHGSKMVIDAVLRALQFDPEKRFQRAEEFYQALSGIGDAPAFYQPTPDGTIEEPPRQDPVPPVNPTHRGWQVPGIAVLGVVVTAILLLFIYPIITNDKTGPNASKAEINIDETPATVDSQDAAIQSTGNQGLAVQTETEQTSKGYSELALQNIAEIIDEAEGLEARGDFEGAQIKIKTALEVYPDSEQLKQKEASLLDKIDSQEMIKESHTEDDESIAHVRSGGETVRWQGTLNKNKLYQLVTNPKDVETIEFLDTLEGAPEYAMDLSETGDGSVLGWLDGNALLIAGRGGVTAPKDCSFLFSIDEAWEEEKAYGHWDQLQVVYGTENFITSNVTDMNGMFCYCRSLLELDLNSWDTSHVTNMHRVFLHCDSLNWLNISEWDTSQVTDMKWMFDSCYCLTELDIGRWDTSHVEIMSYMFSRCPNLSVDISGWDLTSLKEDTDMFADKL